MSTNPRQIEDWRPLGFRISDPSGIEVSVDGWSFEFYAKPKRRPVFSVKSGEAGLMVRGNEVIVDLPDTLPDGSCLIELIGTLPDGGKHVLCHQVVFVDRGPKPQDGEAAGPVM